MKKSTIILLGVLGGFILLIVLLVGKYNTLVSLEEDVNNKYAIIDTQLQRRADLIPNLVATVKGYTSHEEKILNTLSEARAKMLSSGNPEEAAEANQQLSNAITNLLVIVENYPDLKANQNFISLSDELSGSENRIAVARVDYNDVVANYNKNIKLFPNNIIANMLGFEEKEYFEADESAQEVPNVSFE